MAKKPVTLDEAVASGQARQLTNKELQQRLTSLEDRLGAAAGGAFLANEPAVGRAVNSANDAVLQGAKRLGSYIAGSYYPVPLTPAEQLQKSLEAYMHYKYGGENALKDYYARTEGGNSMSSQRASAVNASAKAKGVNLGKPAMSDEQFVLNETGGLKYGAANDTFEVPVDAKSRTQTTSKAKSLYDDPVFQEYFRFKYGMQPVRQNPMQVAQEVLGKGARVAGRVGGGILGAAAAGDDVARRARVYESQGMSRNAATGQAINDALENFLTAGFSDAGYDVNTFSEMNKGSRMRAYEDYLNRRGNVSILDVPAALALQGVDVVEGMGQGLAGAVRNIPKNINYYLGNPEGWSPEMPAGSEFYRRGRAPGY